MMARRTLTFWYIKRETLFTKVYRKGKMKTGQGIILPISPVQSSLWMVFLKPQKSKENL